MGGAKRLRKRWTPPKRIWNVARIKEEQDLKKEFGLKNTRELWRAKAELKRMRTEARLRLAKKDPVRESQLISRVKRYFIPKEEATIDDVLSLDVRSVLSRRLQTIVFKKAFAKTPNQARQLITHGHIAVNGKKVGSPSKLVSLSEEESVNWFGKPLSEASAGGEEFGMATTFKVHAKKNEKPEAKPEAKEGSKEESKEAAVEAEAEAEAEKEEAL